MNSFASPPQSLHPPRGAQRRLVHDKSSSTGSHGPLASQFISATHGTALHLAAAPSCEASYRGLQILGTKCPRQPPFDWQPRRLRIIQGNTRVAVNTAARRLNAKFQQTRSKHNRVQSIGRDCPAHVAVAGLEVCRSVFLRQHDGQHTGGLRRIAWVLGAELHFPVISVDFPEYRRA